MMRNMSHNSCGQIVSFLNFGGTDLNLKIPSHIIVAATSPTIGRAWPILILR